MGKLRVRGAQSHLLCLTHRVFAFDLFPCPLSMMMSAFLWVALRLIVSMGCVKPHPATSSLSLSSLLVNPQRGCLVSLQVQSKLNPQEGGEPGPPLCLGRRPCCPGVSGHLSALTSGAHRLLGLLAQWSATSLGRNLEKVLCVVFGTGVP